MGCKCHEFNTCRFTMFGLFESNVLSQIHPHVDAFSLRCSFWETPGDESPMGFPKQRGLLWNLIYICLCIYVWGRHTCMEVKWQLRWVFPFTMAQGLNSGHHTWVKPLPQPSPRGPLEKPFRAGSPCPTTDRSWLHIINHTISIQVGLPIRGRDEFAAWHFNEVIEMTSEI